MTVDFPSVNKLSYALRTWAEHIAPPLVTDDLFCQLFCQKRNLRWSSWGRKSNEHRPSIFTAISAVIQYLHKVWPGLPSVRLGHSPTSAARPRLDAAHSLRNGPRWTRQPFVPYAESTCATAAVAARSYGQLMTIGNRLPCSRPRRSSRLSWRATRSTLLMSLMRYAPVRNPAGVSSKQLLQVSVAMY